MDFPNSYLVRFDKAEVDFWEQAGNFLLLPIQMGLGYTIWNVETTEETLRTYNIATTIFACTLWILPTIAGLAMYSISKTHRAHYVAFLKFLFKQADPPSTVPPSPPARELQPTPPTSTQIAQQHHVENDPLKEDVEPATTTDEPAPPPPKLAAQTAPSETSVVPATTTADEDPAEALTPPPPTDRPSYPPPNLVQKETTPTLPLPPKPAVQAASSENSEAQMKSTADEEPIDDDPTESLTLLPPAATLPSYPPPNLVKEEVIPAVSALPKSPPSPPQIAGSPQGPKLPPKKPQTLKKPIPAATST